MNLHRTSSPYQQSPVPRHYSQLCIDRRPTGDAPPFPVSIWALHLYVTVIFRIHSAKENEFWRGYKIFVDVKLQLSLTFFVQKIVGTGFPEALHSSVTAPPLRAVIWPLDGTALTLGGTENYRRKRFTLASHNVAEIFIPPTDMELFCLFIENHIQY